MSVNQIQIHVENIKCGGCEKSIVKGLNTIKGLSNIVIDRDQQLISVTAEQSLRDAIAAKLKSMGYPAQVTSDPANQTKVQRRSCKSGSSCCCN